MISKKAKYAIKALKALTEAYGNGPVLIAQIAAQESIPQKFLETILLDLRNHGVLQSQKGKGGGYRLRVEPERINLAQVIRIIDGPIAPTPCVSLNFYVRCDDCADEETCAIRPIMLRVRDANLAVYETTTMRMLVDRVKPAVPASTDQLTRYGPPAEPRRPIHEPVSVASSDASLKEVIDPLEALLQRTHPGG